MSYEDLKNELGIEAAERLEDAVLLAMAHARGGGQTSEKALRTILLAMAGAVIWSRADNRTPVADIVRECSEELHRCLNGLHEEEKDRHRLTG
jgi:hypothetical protein